MSWADSKRMFKGLAVLFICIMLGVMVAEKQINNLTEYHDFVQACNIQGNSNESYSLYFLGYPYTLPAATELARFIKMGQRQDMVPEKVREFTFEVNALFTAAKQDCVKRAYQTKKWLEEEWQEFFYEIKNY